MRRSFVAGDGVTAAGVDRDWLRRLLPRVDPDRVAVREAPGWFRRMWGRRIAAVTMPWAVYFTPAMMDLHDSGAEPARIARLLVHELAHVEQLHRLGVLRHVVQYVADYFGGRLRGRGHWNAYREIRLEVEARGVARLVMAGPL